MAQTGMQRSLTLEITKKINDVIQPDYPVLYQGREAFVYNNISYPGITQHEMASMETAIYQQRLDAFTAYVEQKEAGLNIASDLEAGAEAYRENEDACPIDYLEN